MGRGQGLGYAMLVVGMPTRVRFFHNYNISSSQNEENSCKDCHVCRFQVARRLMMIMLPRNLVSATFLILQAVT